MTIIDHIIDHRLNNSMIIERTFFLIISSVVIIMMIPILIDKDIIYYSLNHIIIITYSYICHLCVSADGSKWDYRPTPSLRSGFDAIVGRSNRHESESPHYHGLSEFSWNLRLRYLIRS